MPAGFVWVVLVMGLVVVAGCLLLPREIGKENEPIVDVHVDLPRVEDIAAHVRDARWRFAQRVKRPARPAPAASAPSAMGAPQPVLSQQLPAPYVLPLNGDNGNN